MKLLVALLLLSTPFVAFQYWVIGLFRGFRFWDKLSPKLKRWLRIYGWLALLGGGGGTSVAMMHGCVSLGSIQQYVEASGPSTGNFHPTKSRSLGSLAPPPMKVLTRLRADVAKQAKERQEEQRRELVTEIRSISYRFAVNNDMREQKRTRVGPFCHVTCSVHHGASYDRETLPEFCSANWIPPETDLMPGWYPMTNEVEYTAAWPGPATPGFHSYKLYWSPQ